jgi:hypothetical protein
VKRNLAAGGTPVSQGPHHDVSIADTLENRDARCAVESITRDHSTSPRGVFSIG